MKRALATAVLLLFLAGCGGGGGPGLATTDPDVPREPSDAAALLQARTAAAAAEVAARTAWEAARRAVADVEAQKSADPAGFTEAQRAVEASAAAHRDAQVAAASARATTTVADAERYKAAAEAASNRANAAFEDARRYAAAVTEAHRRSAASDAAALLQARTAAAAAEVAARTAWEAARRAVADVEAQKSADPAGFAEAQRAVEASAAAHRDAQVAAASARATTTVADAERYKAAAEAALDRANAAFEDARRYAAAVTEAHRRSAASDAAALLQARTAAATAEVAARTAWEAARRAVADVEAQKSADPAGFAAAQRALEASAAAHRDAQAAAASARRAATLADAERYKAAAEAASNRANAALEDARRYAAAVIAAHRLTPADMEALRRAAAAAEAATTLAWTAWATARIALELVEANRDADPAAYARAQNAMDAAERAWLEASAALEKSRAARIVAEAERHKRSAEAAQDRAEVALSDARRHAAAVTAAHRTSVGARVVHLAPVFEVGGRTNTGARPPPAAGGFASAGTRGGVALSTGTVRDGASAADVIAYLHAVTTDTDREDPVVGLGTLHHPPAVRLVEGTDARYAALARDAVRIVNAALPYDKRLWLDGRRVTAPSDALDVPEGEIVMQFAPQQEWPYRFDVYPLGVAFPTSASWWIEARQRWEVTYGQSGHILINTAHIDDTWADAIVLSAIVHELLHTLGLQYHVDPARFPGATLTPFASDPPAHILALVDRDALLAAYGRFAPGTLPEDMSVENLGPWEEETFHLRGALDAAGAAVSFGVGSRNGLAQPWASGPAPGTDLADNRALSGSATWTGALLGVSRPAGHTVAGDARLTVELSTLAGDLDFINLERWGPKVSPGAAGSGSVWGDGDLEYTIRVSGNGFERTGGDRGEIVGAFFGSAHEGMGGVLEREDLAAGFGGKR